MTPEDAFLEDIREHPDDDAPRLIFADWLEDNGESDRAEFIRARILRRGLAGSDSQQADQAEEAYRQRAKTLLHANWQRWAEPLAAFFGSSSAQFNWPSRGYHGEALAHFPRGFIEAVQLDAGRFLEVAADLFRAYPIRVVAPHQADDHAGQLAECPQLVWVEQLVFADYYRAPLGARAMAILARSPHLTRLRSVGLYRNHLGDDGAAALATASWLGSLRDLVLTDNGLSERGAAALARTERAFRPERLRLDHNPIGDLGVIALAGSPVLQRVRSLTLSHCAIGLGGMTALAASPNLGALEEIDLTGNELTSHVLARLDAAPWRRRVRMRGFER
jgi:uncharacterized protein (TIGR02996 family)